MRCNAPSQKAGPKRPKNPTPVPYFGNKRHVAPGVWQRLGDCPSYVEPFVGAGAVLLSRPDDHRGGREVVNDADGLVANFWRATRAAAETVLEHAADPVSELDIAARHLELCRRRPELVEALATDPRYFNAELAGWWAYGQSSTIGGGWCQARELRRLPNIGSRSGVKASCGPDRLRRRRRTRRSAC